MIINAYRPDPEGSDWIYKRWRDKGGNLLEENITGFKPYFWILENTDDRLVNTILSRYPGSEIDRSQTATALKTEQALVKVYAYRQSDIRTMQKEFGMTWEADLSLTDRYLIDEIHEMPEWKPRVWHFDLEWDPYEDFTTVMSVADNYNNRNVTFCWSEESAKQEKKGLVSEEMREVNHEGVRFSYERYTYTDESSMHEAFLDYLEECNPDIFVAHALMWADLPHLVRRLKNFRKLSPLGRVLRPPKNERGYKYTDQPIIGRLCFDTAAPYDSGTGFERVWKDSGKPQLASRKLDYITGEDVLNYGGKFDMDVFTGWRERFDEYCDYCMQDTLLLKRMDEENHVLNFFLSLQRICGVTFSSCHNVTRFARGLLSRRTHWKAPTNANVEKQDYEGAYIPPPKPGRYEGVACVDYKGLYPSLILSHNLSWETQVDKNRAGEEGIHKLPDGTVWNQSKKGLLPQIVEEMFELRDEYKRRMKEAETPTERAGWNTMQLATKRVMASLYGMVASSYWGWCDFDIANAITACGREAIKFLMEESEAQGYEALYGHTDSAFVKVPFDEAPALAKHLTDKVQVDLNASHLIVEFEAYMPYWVVAGKNLYYGICSWPPEDEGKPKSARFGKISTLAPISRNLERDILTMICTGAQEADVIGHIRPISLKIKNGNVELKQITGVTRISKRLDQYDKPTLGAKAAIYYNKHMAERFNQPNFDEGDSVPWVYVASTPDWAPPTKIVSYRDAKELEGFTLDWDIMVDKLVKNKIKPIFESLTWDLERASGAAMPKRYW